MTNREIIQETLNLAGIDYNYNGSNLNTFATWKAQGYSVKKGEHALITVELWINKKYTASKKNEDGSTEEVDKSKMYAKKSFLFGEHQVEPIKEGK